MWQGQQPPGGEQNPQGQSQNPYQQPGYHQPNPYGQQAPWNAPTVPGGPGGTPPAAPEPPRGGGNRTKLIAVAAAGAVVVAAGVTGVVLLGGDKDDEAAPDPTASASSGPTADDDAHARTGDGVPEPTVPGWKVVVNPKLGIAFDAPADWSLESRDWAGGVVDIKDADDDTADFLAAYAAPAHFKEKWCASDDDKDGVKDYTPLASAGTRGNRGAKSVAEAARHDAVNWVYGVYTQPDRKRVTGGPTEAFTSKSGLKGSLVSASSSGADRTDKCSSDGKATVFAFKNSEGRFLSWSFHGAKGVKEELPEATVRKMAATVREYDADKT